MKLHILLASFILALSSVSASALGLVDVEDVVKRANEAAFYAGKDGRAEARMMIVDRQGRKQLRQFTMLRHNVEVGGEQFYYVQFSRPADVRNTAFLVNKHTNADDDRWLYLPGLDLVKRIAAGDKRTSFVGAHFFYEDVSGRGVDEDTHEFVEMTDKHYVILNKPKDKASAEFAEYTVWINRDHFLPEKIEYKNAKGDVYRRMEALKVEIIEGKPTATKSRVDDLASGGYTLMEMRFIDYDMGIPKEIFSERSLRNPPREWLKRPKK
ncbi:MAG: outer membrane lipoprotein-sorting protein [Cellvibrionaceae bacterium]